MINRKCKVCGKVFGIYKYEISKKNRRSYCSRKCWAVIQRKIFAMKGNPNWKGGKKNHDGYVMVRKNNGYKFEHRAVMEKLLGRKLLSTEYVHHKNGDKADNRIENLVIYKGREHVKVHYSMRHKCPTCGKLLQDSAWRNIHNNGKLLYGTIMQKRGNVGDMDGLGRKV